MKYVNLESWSRRDHYKLFSQMDYPHFNVCANVDITKLYQFTKDNNLSFFKTVLFISTKSANSIKEFRFRIRDMKVIEHDFVNPSFTVMTKKEAFSFCYVKYTDNFKSFYLSAEKGIEAAASEVNIEDEPGQDNLLYISSLPWVTFTSISHPIHFSPTDSIPRITWGKFFNEGDRLKLPLSIQVHHALLDGLHVGQYFTLFQEILDNPIKFLE